MAIAALEAIGSLFSPLFSAGYYQTVSFFPGMMFLCVAFICLSSAIIVSSIASHSHNHNRSHTHLAGQGLDLGLQGDSERDASGTDRGDETNDYGRYVPIVDETSPRPTKP